MPTISLSIDMSSCHSMSCWSDKWVNDLGRVNLAFYAEKCMLVQDAIN